MKEKTRQNEETKKIKATVERAVEILNEETKKIKATVERAVEILKEEPSLKHYEAIEKAKSETYEVE